MDQYKTETNASTDYQRPIFASVWLTLFNELRKYYSEQQAATLASKRMVYPEKNDVSHSDG